MSIQLVLVTLFLAVACLSAAKLAVVPALASRAEHRKAEARKAFEEETRRLEMACEIGPYSKLSLWIAAEEEREKRQALIAERAKLHAEGEARRKELIALRQKARAEQDRLTEEARVCVDGGEHAVKSNKMECRICGKPFNPFRPKSFEDYERKNFPETYRRHNPTAGERYAAEKRRVNRQLEMLERQHLRMKADFVETSSRLLTNEMINDYLKMMENENRWRRTR